VEDFGFFTMIVLLLVQYLYLLSSCTACRKTFSHMDITMT